MKTKAAYVAREIRTADNKMHADMTCKRGLALKKYVRYIGNNCFQPAVVYIERKR